MVDKEGTVGLRKFIKATCRLRECHVGGARATDSVDELWASAGREGPPMVSPKRTTIRDAVKQRPAEQGFPTLRAASRHVVAGVSVVS